MNDLLVAADAGKSSDFVLLDLNALFDTVNHSVLLELLKHWVGICCSVLMWFYSDLQDRSFSEAIGKSWSSSVKMTCGVPQGSVLGPLLFSLYMLPLGHVIGRHNVSFQSYADDTKLYLSFNPNYFFSKLIHSMTASLTSNAGCPRTPCS